MDTSGIRTDNLRLVAVEPLHVEALSRDKRELAEVLGVAVPDGGPQFPEAFAPPEDGGSSRSERPPTDWRGYFFVHPRGRALVGNGGFTGDPDDSATWRSATRSPRIPQPRVRDRGGAGHIGYAFAHADARVAAVAHTLAETNASNAVLRKAGMSFVAEVDDPEAGGVAVADKQGRTPPRGCRKNGVRVHTPAPTLDKEARAVGRPGAQSMTKAGGRPRSRPSSELEDGKIRL